MDIAPGATEEVVINAPPGEYEYSCNVPGHKEAGMVGTLTAAVAITPPVCSRRKVPRVIGSCLLAGLVLSRTSLQPRVDARKSVHTDIRRVPYDVASKAAAIRAADGLPDHFATDIETGGAS